MRRSLLGGFRLTGLSLVVVALSAVGLITTSAALELFRFGELSFALNGRIDAVIERQQVLYDLSQALATAERDGGSAVRDDLERAARAAGVDADASAPEALPQMTAKVAALAHEAADTLKTDIALWGEASASLSEVLSLLLASIVVLLFTVVLRMLAYLSARDRTEAQLRSAMAEAKAANAAKSDFLATMSHEIRTPLTAIRGYSELLAGGPLDPAQRDQLDRLRDANAALGLLIDDILDLSKIEAGRFDLHPAPFDMAALMDRVLGLVLPSAQAKGLSMTSTIAPDVPRHLTGDAARLLQVLLNLTNNAVKFTDAGRVEVRVERRGESLLLAVRDTGMGIAAEDIPKLFKRFSQIDNSLSRVHAGTGLGLAISRGLVERMGGDISVESCPGQGTEFTVTLPLVSADAPDGAVGTDRALTPMAARVLVVEDSPQNQDLIQAVLHRDGYSCTAAFDGVEGLAAASAGGFDLVIMDMQMPRMDGIAATAAIRALPAPKGRVPILGLSANALGHQVAAMRAAGADAHMAKPFGIEDLSRSVAHLLCRGEVAPPADDLADFDALVALLGQERVKMRLDGVISGLGWTGETPLAPDLRHKAHRLVAEAGQLGLTALAEAAARLEEAIDAGADLTQPMAALACEAALARAAVPRLTARLGQI